MSSEERSLAGDIRHLVHALFEDVRAENVLAPSPSASATSTASSGSASGSSFASGLAALISQIQAGSAPANLQQAFDALVANLEQVGGATPAATSSTSQSASTASTSSTSSGATTVSSSDNQALLVQFLTNLQSDLGLGYGGATGTPAQGATSGVTVNTTA